MFLRIAKDLRRNILTWRTQAKRTPSRAAWTIKPNARACTPSSAIKLPTRPRQDRSVRFSIWRKP